jgi:phage terminase large subunit-like protein
VAEVAGALGVDLLPWQRDVLDVALEHHAEQLCYRDVVVTRPRQGGKSTLLLALIVWRMLAHPGQRLAFAAQSRLAARNKLFDDWFPLLRRSELGSLFELTRATGNEALRASNGSLLRILSTEEASGHGESLDLVLLDECWALDAYVEQAVRPAMVTKANAQIWSVSTAGTARSGWWRSKVDTARAAAEAGVVDGLCFFEWSAPGEADAADRATWWAAHPALGATITEDVFAADFAAMPLAEFRRSHLNQWAGELADAGWNVIDRALWEGARL